MTQSSTPHFHGSLTDRIRFRMARSLHGDISFYEYMNDCLYDPDHGYYVRDVPKIGKEGDFYTSAHIGNVMGKMLARFIADKTVTFDHFTVVEWGGGSGRLALHILDEMRDHYPETYRRMRWISVEKSGYHKQEQLKTLSDHQMLFSFQETMPFFHTPVIVLANELLDAFPVYRIKREENRFVEMRVYWDERQARFNARWTEPVDERLKQELAKLNIERLRPGQQAELNPDAVEWIKDIGQKMDRGVVIVIDYGDVEEELWSPHRMDGTFLCYYKHRAHDDPFYRPGEQDMTAHVNFTPLMREAEKMGFQYDLQTQKRFLLDAGVLDLLVNHHSTDPFSQEVRINRAIRQLLISDGMSELFKVLVLER